MDLRVHVKFNLMQIKTSLWRMKMCEVVQCHTVLYNLLLDHFSKNFQRK